MRIATNFGQKSWREETTKKT